MKERSFLVLKSLFMISFFTPVHIDEEIQLKWISGRGNLFTIETNFSNGRPVKDNPFEIKGNPRYVRQKHKHNKTPASNSPKLACHKKRLSYLTIATKIVISSALSFDLIVLCWNGRESGMTAIRKLEEQFATQSMTVLSGDLFRASGRTEQHTVLQVESATSQIASRSVNGHWICVDVCWTWDAETSVNRRNGEERLDCLSKSPLALLASISFPVKSNSQPSNASSTTTQNAKTTAENRNRRPYIGRLMQ